MNGAHVAAEAQHAWQAETDARARAGVTWVTGHGISSYSVRKAVARNFAAAEVRRLVAREAAS